MHFEVFHHGLLGRHDIIAADMIHYSGLWGVCFSHHHPNNNHPRYAADTSTEVVLRFLATEDARPFENYTVTTHHVDADAVLPVWSLLHPEAALKHRDLFVRTARAGDFFTYIDDESAKLNFIVEALFQRMRAGGDRGDRVIDDNLTQRCFDWMLPRWGGLLDNPDDGADLWQPPMRELFADLEYLNVPGRVTELWDRHTSLVETDHVPDAHALNTACRNDLLLVWRTDGAPPTIDVRPAIAWYAIQSMPHYPHYDLADLANRLNAAEEAAGHAPNWQHNPGPVNLRVESSALSQATLLDTIKQWLDATSAEHIPTAYRADVREVFCHLPRHAIYTSHQRFTEAEEICFRPGAHYEGLHLARHIGIELEPLRIDPSFEGMPSAHASHLNAFQFAVSDDFYWNQREPQPLELRFTYQDRGPGSLHVEYETWQNPFQPTAPIELHGDGELHTATLRLDDARFGNGQDWGDLRLAWSPGTQLGVTEVALRKL